MENKDEEIEKKFDEEVAKTLTEVLDDVDDLAKKSGHKFIDLLSRLLKDKLDDLWKENKIIIQNRISKELGEEKSEEKSDER